MTLHPSVIPIVALLLTIGVVGGGIVTYRSYKEEKVVAEAKARIPKTYGISEMDKMKMRLREHEIKEEVEDIKFRQRVEREMRKVR